MDSVILEKLLKTFIVLVLLVLLRFALQKGIKRSSLKSAALRQRWNIQIRNACLFLFIFCGLVIWGEQIQHLLISLLAVLAAIVIATKELILCLTGSILKAGTQSFSLGDHVRVGDFNGLVVDQTLLSTTLYDTGDNQNGVFFTGKTIVIPNSLFLSNGIVNENNSEQYKLHSLTIKLKNREDFDALEDGLKKKMTELSAKDKEAAFQSLKKQFPVSDITHATCDPRIIINGYDGEGMTLLLRMVVETSQVRTVDQDLLRFHFKQLADLKEAKA